MPTDRPQSVHWPSDAYCTAHNGCVQNSIPYYHSTLTVSALYSMHTKHSMQIFIQPPTYMLHSKRDISASEVRSGVRTIMAAIVKSCSKPKCSKLATSRGPSELRISKGTTNRLCTHDSLHWFNSWLAQQDDADLGSKEQLFGPLHPSFLWSSQEGKPFVGMSPSERNAAVE